MTARQENDYTNYLQKVNQAKISRRNKELILDFDRSCTVEGLSFSRRTNYLRLLLHMVGKRCKKCSTIELKDGFKYKANNMRKCKHNFTGVKPWLEKDLDKTTKKDIEDIVFEVQKNYNETWTIQGYKIALKKFYKWHLPQEDPKAYPEQVRWINTKIKASKKKAPENLPSLEDVQKMADMAKTLRDKAMILVQYESGARPHELLSLRLKHISHDDYGTVLHIPEGKTGFRPVRIAWFHKELNNWLTSHPFKDDPEAPLWASYHKSGEVVKCKDCGYEWALHATEMRCPKKGCRSFNVQNMGKMRCESIALIGYYDVFKQLALRAKLKVHANPYSMRHARASHMAPKLTEAVMCKMFGWVLGSNMPRTYVHLSGRDVDKAVLKSLGVIVEDSEGNEGIRCIRCRQINSPTNKFCKDCRLPLTPEAVAEVETKKEREREEMISELLVRVKKEIAPGGKIEHYAVVGGKPVKEK
jgi:site-specific recombinase XerD